MPEIKVDESLVAACGLYCAACRAYLKKRCPGCRDNVRATWCKVRTCNLDAGRKTCAECRTFSRPKECAKFNNFIARMFGLIFNSDRGKCIGQISALGMRGHAEAMAKLGRQSMPRK